MSVRTTTALLLAAALGTTGCAGLHRPTGPTLQQDVARLEQELDLLPEFPSPSPATGSLWTDAGPGAALVRDARAWRTNDLLKIRVQEASLGTNESATDLARSSSQSWGASVAMGLENPNPVPGRFNLGTVLDSSTDSSFQGDGKTSRSNRLSGVITARVMRVLPNGDLVIAGQKTVMVNRERQILTLVGSVRPVDVGPTNEIASSAVGDLTVRLWGRGEVDETTRQGWFVRMLNKIWPF